jgi:site-specific recombinase XerD
VDAFLNYQRDNKCRTATLVAYCQGLRSFFTYAERQAWCRAGISAGIKSPRLTKYRFGQIAPTWSEVKRLLKLMSGRDPACLRARAITLLLAIYGLRASEICDLRLSDFDWKSETFGIRRVKRGGTQRYPIQWEVGQALLHYLQYARPQSGSDHLFLTMRTPYRPLGRRAVWEIIGPKMRSAGINTQHVGPHALRHACASRLLKKGVSMHEIAEFLGHKDTRSVGIYARFDTRLLKWVAAFRLGVQ